MIWPCSAVSAKVFFARRAAETVLRLVPLLLLGDSLAESSRFYQTGLVLSRLPHEGAVAVGVGASHKAVPRKRGHVELCGLGLQFSHVLLANLLVEQPWKIGLAPGKGANQAICLPSFGRSAIEYLRLCAL